MLRINIIIQGPCLVFYRILIIVWGERISGFQHSIEELADGIDLPLIN